MFEVRSSKKEPFASSFLLRTSNYRQILRELTERFSIVGIASAAAEAAWLLSEATGLSRTELYLQEQPLEALVLRHLEMQVAQRLSGVPLQYVLGTTDFCGHRLSVAPGVFIPRPETEILAERAIAALRARRMPGRAPLRVLELGTGTGALSVAIAAGVPACVVAAVELSWNALHVAAANLRAHSLSQRVMLCQGDWTGAVRGRFDLIVSNPPYIPTAITEQLLRQQLVDPRESLDGGPDGLVFYERLLEEAPRLLSSGGALGVECAEEQAAQLQQRFRRCSWARDVVSFSDLAGRPRGVWVETT